MRSLGSIVLALMLSCTASYAAKKFPLTAASTVPAARGTAEVGKDRNGNTEVTLKVEHLATPESLSPPRASYIVWLQEKGTDPENQGQLRVNHKLQGSFRTVTPRKSFDLFITGEQDPTVKARTGPEVLRATIQP